MRGIDSGGRTPSPGARRVALVVVAVIGLALAVAPFAFGMFDRGAQGAVMMREFKPFMTDARLSGFQQHIRDIDAGVRDTAGPVATELEGRGPGGRAGVDTRLGL